MTHDKMPERIWATAYPSLEYRDDKSQAMYVDAMGVDKGVTEYVRADVYHNVAKLAASQTAKFICLEGEYAALEQSHAELLDALKAMTYLAENYCGSPFDGNEPKKIKEKVDLAVANAEKLVKPQQGGE